MAEGLRIKVHEGGLLARSIINAPIETFQARRNASVIVKAKNRIVEKVGLLSELIKGHEINNFREVASEFTRDVHILLEATYRETFKILLFSKQMLLEDVVFFKKHGSELSLEELETYRRFLDVNKATLDDVRKYVNELNAALDGKEVSIGALNLAAKLYSSKKIFLLKMFERIGTKGLVGSLIRNEERIVKIESRRRITKKSIHEILLRNKKFDKDFKEFVTRMFIFTLIGIRSAVSVRDKIELAVSEKQLDLPANYKEEFAKPLSILLKDEKDVIWSLNKDRLQLQKILSKVEDRINDSIIQVSRKEKELKKAA